jgi:hypothetical protein
MSDEAPGMRPMEQEDYEEDLYQTARVLIEKYNAGARARRIVNAAVAGRVPLNLRERVGTLPG